MARHWSDYYEDYYGPKVADGKTLHMMVNFSM